MTEPRLDQLRRESAADVWKGDRRAGRLTRDGDDVVFAYDAGHLADGGPAVARTLPVTAEPVRTPAGAVPAFFAGLLRREPGCGRSSPARAPARTTT